MQSKREVLELLEVKARIHFCAQAMKKWFLPQYWS